jgi:hypothetical protein
MAAILVIRDPDIFFSFAANSLGGKVKISDCPQAPEKPEIFRRETGALWISSDSRIEPPWEPVPEAGTSSAWNPGKKKKV